MRDSQSQIKFSYCQSTLPELWKNERKKERARKKKIRAELRKKEVFRKDKRMKDFAFLRIWHFTSSHLLFQGNPTYPQKGKMWYPERNQEKIRIKRPCVTHNSVLHKVFFYTYFLLLWPQSFCFFHFVRITEITQTNILNALGIPHSFQLSHFPSNPFISLYFRAFHCNKLMDFQCTYYSN